MGPVVSEEKMFKMLTDGRTDAGVIGILLAHQWALGSGELKSEHTGLIHFQEKKINGKAKQYK